MVVSKSNTAFRRKNVYKLKKDSNFKLFTRKLGKIVMQKSNRLEKLEQEKWEEN